MRLKAASILIILFTASAVLAQRDCGNGLPCGRIPWDLPIMPRLSSPTPMPTIVIPAEVTEEPGPTAAPTYTPAPTGTIAADFSEIGDQLSTLSAVVNATPVPVLVSGTPVDTGAQLVELGSDAGIFFGYVRGFSEANLGGLSQFVTFALFSLVVIIGIKAFGWILPVAAVVFRIILRIVEVVKALIGL